MDKNKNLMSRCTPRIKTWAKAMLEENDRRFFRLIAITTTKSKKQMMNRVKNVATTPNNSCDIVDMDESNGNGNENEKCKEDFSL